LSPASNSLSIGCVLRAQLALRTVYKREGTNLSKIGECSSRKQAGVSDEMTECGGRVRCGGTSYELSETSDTTSADVDHGREEWKNERLIHRQQLKPT
jgi:hypothetical protein